MNKQIFCPKCNESNISNISENKRGKKRRDSLIFGISLLAIGLVLLILGLGLRQNPELVKGASPFASPLVLLVLGIWFSIQGIYNIMRKENKYMKRKELSREKRKELNRKRKEINRLKCGNCGYEFYRKIVG